MGLHCGVDLHGNNGFYGIVEQDGRRVLGRRVSNDLGEALKLLEPYRERLVEVVVESTFNWYWLVDGLRDHGYRVRLANPAAMEQYSGLKHADDRNDAFFVAELSRLGIVPEGYIYPLLRRRAAGADGPGECGDGEVSDRADPGDGAPGPEPGGAQARVREAAGGAGDRSDTGPGDHAGFMRRYCPEAKAWHQRKLRRSKAVVATKALAAKLARACYFLMRDRVGFEVAKMFG